jgi:hypothetical protein
MATDIIPGTQQIVFPPDYFYGPTYDWASRVDFDWFSYVLPAFTVDLAAAGTSVVQVTIQADSDFELRQINVAATAPGELDDPLVTLMIQDTGSGRNLMSAPAPISAVANIPGIVYAPRDMVWPKLFSRNATIVATLNNGTGSALTDYVVVTLVGRKIYQFGN